MKKIFLLSIFAILVWKGYEKYSQDRHQTKTTSEHAFESEAEQNVPVIDVSAASRSTFVCDGRTYCSQMKSCDEAKYFLEHCPNVKMDGNHDGIPCEQQWCS